MDPLSLPSVYPSSPVSKGEDCALLHEETMMGDSVWLTHDKGKTSDKIKTPCVVTNLNILVISNYTACIVERLRIVLNSIVM